VNPWLLAVALLLAISCAFGGMSLGRKLERQVWQERDLAKAEKMIVQVRKEAEVRETTPRGQQPSLRRMACW